MWGPGSVAFGYHKVHLQALASLKDKGVSVRFWGLDGVRGSGFRS